jgi:uncharacterized membrane protein
MTPESTTNAIDVSVSAAKVGSVVAHVKKNNVSYLLGILIGHMLGITDQVLSYGQGMC